MSQAFATIYEWQSIDDNDLSSIFRNIERFQYIFIEVAIVTNRSSNINAMIVLSLKIVEKM